MKFTARLWIYSSLLSLILLLPPTLMAADKRVVFFPVTVHADPSKTYLRQGFTSMFVSRLAGGGIEVVDEGQLSSHTLLATLDLLMSEADRYRQAMAGAGTRDAATTLLEEIQRLAA